MTQLVGGGLAFIFAGLVFLGMWAFLRWDAEREWVSRERAWRPPAIDDPEEWNAPLRTGSRSAERAMIRFHKEHGLLLFKRASKRTRQWAVAVEKYRPRGGETGWGRHTSPVPEPELVPLPPEPNPGEHFDVGGVPVDERLPMYSWQTGEFAKDMLEELLAEYTPDGAP